MQKSDDSYQHYCDRKDKERSLSAGDKVVFPLPTGNKKLIMQWQGSYEILAKVNRWNYVITENEEEKNVEKHPSYNKPNSFPALNLEKTHRILKETTSCTIINRMQ